MINNTTSHQIHQNNFTVLRWLAAGLVLYGHSFVFLGLPAPSFMSWASLGALGVYIFFAISGYLVAQSWVSDPHPFRFLQRRALRIFPGLVVCITLTVLMLGPLLTKLPIFEYFSHVQTRNYFSNIALYMSYNLPGVFTTNHYPNAINGSLWSLPAEFSMYFALALVGVARIPKFGWAIVALCFVVLAKLWAMETPKMLVIYRTDFRQVLICGAYFWVGAAAFKYNISRLFTVSNVLGAVIIWLMLTRWPQLFVIASWIILPFLVIAFGMAHSPILSRFAKYDYSYGIYIYAFPVQQTIAHFWPHMPLKIYLIVTGIITVILAGLSWHWIERPALKLKPPRPI
ncbi:MAG: acyltransferase [Desulforhopalus sp.]|nr:acyltransferase [Desulforhopalus sp.]